MHNMFNQKSHKPKPGSPAAILMRGHHASGGEATPLPQKTKVRSNPSNHYATGGEATPLPQKTRVSSNPSNHYEAGGLSMGRAAPNLSNSFRKGGHPCRKRRAPGGMLDNEQHERNEMSAMPKRGMAKLNAMPARKRATGGYLPELQSKDAMHPQKADALKRGGRAKREHHFFGEMVRGIMGHNNSPTIMQSLMQAGQGIAHHLQQTGAEHAELERLRAAQPKPAATAGQPLRRGGRAHRDTGGYLSGKPDEMKRIAQKMQGSMSKSRQMEEHGQGMADHHMEDHHVDAMHPQSADKLRRGGRTHQKRQKHFAGMMAAALPFLAPLVGQALSGLFSGGGGGGEQEAKRGGRIKRTTSRKTRMH